MTSNADNPGTGYTLQGDPTALLSVEKILTALGFAPVLTVDPQDRNNQSNQRTHPIEKQHRTNYAQQQSQSHRTYLCPCNSLNRHVVSHCQHHTSAYSSHSIDNRWHLLFGAVRWLG